jgi:hypothetical protein
VPGVVDIQFWEGLKATSGAVPAGGAVGDLIAELEEMLADPDGHIRDQLAFEILGDWVIRGVCDHQLAQLGDRRVRALDAGLGEAGTDSVFGRSFAALILGLVIERDNAARLLPGATVRAWCEAVLCWFAAERDLRGVVDHGRGVAHAVAHGADVIASLARSRHIDTYVARRLLDAIVGRLATTDGVPLLLSEDERLAYAAMTLLHRGDLRPSELRLALVPARALSALRHRTDLDPAAFARLNMLNWLRAIHLQLHCGVRAMAWYADDGHYAKPVPDADGHREVILDALQRFSFWFAG